MTDKTSFQFTTSYGATHKLERYNVLFSQDEWLYTLKPSSGPQSEVTFVLSRETIDGLITILEAVKRS